MTISRRRFVASTTAGLVGASGVTKGAPAQATTAQSTANISGANERVRVAVIGCGGMGRSHISNFLQVPGTQIVAVCDVWGTNLARAAEMTARQPSGAAKPFKDFRQVLDLTDLDAVVIATPDHWHALPLAMACRAGKDVYVEKPTSVTVAEGRRMVDVAREHRRVVQVGTQQRSGAHFAEAVQLVREGRLGKVRRVDAWNHGNSSPFGIGKPPDGPAPDDLDWDLWLGPAPKVPFNPSRFIGSFRWFWDYAGGQVTDWGVHHLDIINWALEANGPRTVSAVGGRFNDDIGETPDTIEVVYEYPGCVVRYSHRSTNAWTPDGRDYGTLFYGTDGTLFLDRSGYELVPELEGNKEPPKPTFIQDQRGYGQGPVAPWRRPRRTRQARMLPLRADGSDQNLSHILNFYECIKSRKTPVSDIEIGHRSASTAILGNIAYRTGRRIVWNAEKEQIEGDVEASRLLSREYRAPWKL